MVLRLANRLEVPLRERNALLVSAGFAPVYPARSWDDPSFNTIRHAVQALIDAHEPYPALAVDRHWTLVASNRAVATLIHGAATWLLAPPTNVLRLSLHPDGLANRIANYSEWREHLLVRLARQRDQTGDAVLSALHDELTEYPRPSAARASESPPPNVTPIAVPLRLASDAGVLSLLSTTMVFGTPLDVFLSELAIETFLPADLPTARALARLGAS
jgi:hypothetical protein